MFEKKMVKKSIFMLCMVMLIISVVSAIDTEIHVKTLPNHKVSVFIYPTGVISSIDSYHSMVDSNGEIAFVHSSTKDVLDVLVKVTYEGEKIYLEKFEGYTAGDPVWIKMDNTGVDGEYDPVATATPTPTPESTPKPVQTATEDSAADTQGPITGEVISDTASSGGKGWIIYVVIVGILVVGAVVFLVGRNYAMNLANRQSGVDLPKKPGVFTGLFKKVGKTSSSSSASEPEIQDIEAKIRAAQDELNMLRNKDKIKLAEAKLEADRRELEKLKKG